MTSINRQTLAIVGVSVLYVLLPMQGCFGQETATAPAQRFNHKLKPCPVSNLDEDVLCGQYDVYENRAAKKGRKISLNIVLLPAKSSDVEPDPFVFLAGGGVAPATGYAGYFGGAFSDLRSHRDILLIDQRGTGRSNGLECDLSTDATNNEYRNEAKFREAVRRCREKVERKAELIYYTTPLAMDDLDEVRDWLGYPQLNLYGVSYGTQASMVYIRQHPEHVRSVTLQGVLPMDVPVWLDASQNTEHALDQAFSACARDKRCHDAFPNFKEEFNTLLKQLTDHPVKVKVSKPDTKEETEISIDAEVLRGFVASVLYSAERIHDLPLLIHLAGTGDYQPLARKVAFRAKSEIPKGIYLTIVCTEEIPQFNPSEISAATAGTFLGDFRLRRELVACSEWIRGWLPKDFATPVHSDIPALVLTGSLDHVTPPKYGERVAKNFKNVRQIVLPNRGHNDTDPCVAGIITAFVKRGNSEGLNTGCLKKTEDLSFALRIDQLIN